MKKSELKAIIKPLVKECINDLLIEEGLLSKVISEVVSGLGTRETIVEQKVERTDNREEVKRKLQETRNKLRSAIGKDAYGGVNVFEGTEPLKSGGSPGNASSPSSPMSNMDPNDPGVDISGLMNQNWKRLVK